MSEAIIAFPGFDSSLSEDEEMGEIQIAVTTKTSTETMHLVPIVEKLSKGIVVLLT